MASYGKRKDELLGALKTLQPSLPAEEHSALCKAVESYYTGRDEVLTGMQELVADTGDRESAPDYKGKVARGRELLRYALGGALSSIREPSKPGVEFQQAAEAAEGKFWDGLEKLNLAYRRDSLMWMKVNTRQYGKKLEEKWATIISENRPLLEESKNAVQQCMAAVDEAIGKTAPTLERLKNALSNVLDGMGKTADEVKKQVAEFKQACAAIMDQLVPGSADTSRETAKAEAEDLAASTKVVLKGVIGSQVDADSFNDLWDYADAAKGSIAGILRDEFLKYLLSCSAYVQKQANVLVAVPQERAAVREFVQRNSFKVGEQRCSEASEELNRWINDFPKDGREADAKDVAAAFTNGLNNQLKELGSAFDEFESRNRGRFVGELGSDVEKMLTEQGFWDDIASAISGKGSENKLRAWYEETRKVLRSDLEATFQLLENSLREQPEEIGREAETLVAAFKQQLMDRAKKWVEEFDRDVKLALERVNPEKTRQALDRGLLREILLRDS